MKRTHRLLAMLFALILIASTLLGCKLSNGQGDAQPITIDTAEAGQTAAPEETAAPTPTFTISQAALDSLNTLDMDVFRWYATSDGYSFHMFIDDPSKYSIDPATVKMTLGEFTEEDTDRLTVEAGAYLARFEAINREEIPQERQFSYDVLHQILMDLAEPNEYKYYYEPLTEYSGLQANLPLSFALFELKNTRDVEDYLALLADMPRYLGQVLAYEQKRAELEMFMTEPALDAILEDCKAIIDSRDTSFLYTTFNDAIDQLTNLSPEQAQTYKDKNESLLQNEYINAYQTLYDGLKSLRKSCRSYEEASTYNETQKSYFEFCMQDEACNALSVEETLEMLKNEYFYLLYDIYSIQDQNPDIFDTQINLSSGNMETDLDYLKTVISPILPQLPEHNLLLTDVPEELQDMFAPAAYVIPALDDWKDNIIYINTATEDQTLLLTLAHEGYPGHLYQYIDQRSNENIGTMQRVMNFGGYAEGWAQFAEYLVAVNQTKYDSNYVRFQFDYNVLFNAILPAMLSILVNYYGYSEEALQNYVTAVGLDGEQIVSAYYETVVDQPYYFFEYAVGYSQLAQLYRDEQDNLGDKFDMASFLRTYLDLGPGYYELIREKMDVWADGLVSDAA
ncbi:MAG: DUF885 domain-containing protein [Eubacteriales bacterium]|nr:DUF885 domain-containing protein [Eubacteriales bacterium]